MSDDQPVFKLPNRGGTIVDKAQTVKSSIRVDTPHALDRARLALELTMVGIAVNYIENIKTLNDQLTTIESRLLDEADAMDVDNLSELYSKMTERLDNYLAFIRQIVKEANWGDIEQRLLNIQVQTEDKRPVVSNEQLTEIANELVKHMKMGQEGQEPLANPFAPDDSDQE